MKVGLIDVDSHNFPNLPLMKLSAYHKTNGDSVTWWNGMEQYDLVYMSKVFDELYTRDEKTIIRADKIIKGGTGYGLDNKLPQNIEHIYPDYSIYPKFTEAYGFLSRGCPRNCGFCIVGKKEGLQSKQVAELNEFWRGQKTIRLLDPNLLACRDREKLLQSLILTKASIDFTQGLDARLVDESVLQLLKQMKIKLLHFAWDNEQDSDKITKGLNLVKEVLGISHRKLIVYMITNYNTSFEFDLYRVQTLKRLGASPYVMVYNKPTAQQKYRDLQRYVNNRIIFYRCDSFQKYQEYMKRG